MKIRSKLRKAEMPDKKRAPEAVLFLSRKDNRKLRSVMPLGEIAVDLGKESGMGQALRPQSGHSQMRRVADPGRAEIRNASLPLFGVDFRD